MENLKTVATEVVVFMLVSLNGKWKLPIGYFFQNKINPVVQVELIKTALTALTKHTNQDCAYEKLHVMELLQLSQH